MTIEDQQFETWKQAAHQAGADAGIARASWVIDGNTETEHILAVLEMIDSGDPAVADYLPAWPTLSGEWADDLTDGKLYEEITGRDAHADASWNFDAYHATLEELVSAWEAGVTETFPLECERLLREAIA